VFSNAPSASVTFGNFAFDIPVNANALAPSFSTLLLNGIVVKSLQFLKHLFPILMTFFILTLTSEAQFSNAPFSTVLTPFALIDDKLQFANALTPIFSTESGRLTLVRLTLLKTLSPIALTLILLT
jgi:hypothetical protein